ncbi:MAG: hypothetical protein HYS13_11670 [Planctomycetia bacterium]|nr:hypothetical protein [Planctomycetia bacterium]
MDERNQLERIVELACELEGPYIDDLLRIEQLDPLPPPDDEPLHDDWFPPTQDECRELTALRAECRRNDTKRRKLRTLVRVHLPELKGLRWLNRDRAWSGRGRIAEMAGELNRVQEAALAKLKALAAAKPKTAVQPTDGKPKAGAKRKPRSTVQEKITQTLEKLGLEASPNRVQREAHVNRQKCRHILRELEEQRRYRGFRR